MKTEMKKTFREGFTLLETVIYIALFGILMSGAVTASYQLLDGGNRNKMAVLIQEEGTFLNRKINWALMGATSAVVSGGNTLTITRPDLGSESPLVITENGNAMTLKRTGGSAVPLSSDIFKITNTSFVIEPAALGKPQSITASFLVNDKSFISKKYLRQ